jgi:uncharacterized iron-regulated membrane protein
MKLKARTIDLLWDVHAWSGAIAGLVLAAMFLGGTVTLFRGEITAWQEAPATAPARSEIDAAIARHLETHPLTGGSIDVAMPHGDAAEVQVTLRDAAGKETKLAVTGGGDRDGAVSGGRTSAVAALFFQLHFLYHEAFPQGMMIAGLLGVVLVLALVTGLLIHLRRLGEQLFRFRRRAEPRRLWSDLHKVLGVWGLPFQLMIGFTGGVIGIGVVLVPQLARPTVGSDPAVVAREAYGDELVPATPPASPPATAPPAPAALPAPVAMLMPGDLAARAEAALPGFEAEYIAVASWGASGAVATVYGERPGDRLYPQARIALRAADGTLLGIGDGPTRDTQAALEAMYGLHFATYGGLTLRLVYALLGIAGWLTILTGNWIWIERRRERGGRGAELLARLTVGLGGGLLPASAAIFWINRLSAVSDGRPGREVWGFFAVWAAAALIALALPARRRSWALLLAITAAGLVGLPALSRGTVGVVGAVDFGAALFGAACAGAAAVLARREVKS